MIYFFNSDSSEIVENIEKQKIDALAIENETRDNLVDILRFATIVVYDVFDNEKNIFEINIFDNIKIIEKLEKDTCFAINSKKSEIYETTNIEDISNEKSEKIETNTSKVDTIVKLVVKLLCMSITKILI